MAPIYLGKRVLPSSFRHIENLALATALLQSHLEVLCLHVPGREAVKGRPLVYAVGHHQRPVRGHEGARAVQVAPEVHAGHVVGDRLEK